MVEDDKGQSGSFFRLLKEEDREQLLKKSLCKKFKKGKYIIRFMDCDTNLYLINTGRVRVTLFSDQGKEVSFIDIAAGGNFGEFSAIDGKPRSANVIALADTTITVVSPSDFLNILQKYPAVCIEILQQLTGVVRGLCERVFEYATLDVSQRIYAQLLRISKEHLDFDGVARINNPPTHAELASRVSCTREAVSRELKKMEKVGLIKRLPKRLIIEDCGRLQELVDGVSGG